MTISPDYAMLRTFSTRKSKFAANFIEEGICEYVVHYFNEANPISDYTAPENEAELLDEANHINIMYYYSVIYVKDFLDTYGIKRGIEMIIQEAPPSTIELLNPNMYFYRIKNWKNIFSFKFLYYICNSKINKSWENLSLTLIKDKDLFFYVGYILIDVDT